MAKREKSTPKASPNTGKRFVDNTEVRRLLSELHIKQLQELKSRLDAQVIEASEMKLIWEMVKTHGIGIEGIEDLVEDALKAAASGLDDLEFDDEWSANI